MAGCLAASTTSLTVGDLTFELNETNNTATVTGPTDKSTITVADIPESAAASNGMTYTGLPLQAKLSIHAAYSLP